MTAGRGVFRGSNLVDSYGDNRPVRLRDYRISSYHATNT
jgi:hypothetical protein